MKSVFAFTLLLLAFCSASFAQSGNVVVSHVRFDEVTENQCQVTVHIAGNLVSEVADAKIALSGERVILGKDFTFTKPAAGSGNQATIIAYLPLSAAGSGASNDEVTAVITLNRLGSGLDWTYSRVGRIRTDIRR